MIVSEILYVGIVAGNDTLKVAARHAGNVLAAADFPANVAGREALRLYLSSCGIPVRLAVAGAAALGIALFLGNAPRFETFIISKGHLNHAAELARIAEYAI